ncbi:hypothetical protein DHB64_13860 [Antarcticibacterium sp. W02-3]|nr:hypothetical protein [Antarcticibacterium sp. W02-3]
MLLSLPTAPGIGILHCAQNDKKSAAVVFGILRSAFLATKDLWRGMSLSFSFEQLRKENSEN